MHKTGLTIVALIVGASSPTLALAEQSEAYTKCAELGLESFGDATRYCDQASYENDEGRLLNGDFLRHHGLVTLAVHEYERVLEGVDFSKPTQIQYDALRRRALAGLSLETEDPDYDPEEYVVAALKLVPDDVELLTEAAQHSMPKERRRDYADRLVALDPKSVYHHVTRAKVLADIGDLDGALSSAETALKVAPGSPIALSTRGHIYGQRRDYVKAELDHAAVTRKVPGEYVPWVNHAEILIKLERYADARASATKALALEAKQPRALIARVTANLYLGDGESALSDLANLTSEQDAAIAEKLRISAESIIKTQKMITPESVSMLEQDRTTIVNAFASELLNTCGDYSVASNPDPEAIESFRECLKKWYQSRERDFRNFPNIGGTVNRFLETGAWIDDASLLVCSRLGKNARCIDDRLYQRAAAAADDFNDPTAAACKAEFARVNREVDAYNARADRKVVLVKSGWKGR